MKSLYDDLLDALKESELGQNLSVYESYSPQTPQYPAIFIEESLNREQLTIGGAERLTMVAYRFEILTRAEWDETRQGVISRRKQAQRIANQLDEWLRTTFHLTRRGDAVYLPHVDETLGRYIVTYQGYLSDGYIYQKGV